MIFSTPILEIGMHATTHGGLDRFFHGLVSEFARQGIPYRALVFGERSEDASNATSLGPLTLSGPRRLWRVRQEAKRYLCKEKSAVVVTHFALYAFPLLDLLRRMSHVVHFQGPWSGESAMEGHSGLAVFAKRQIEQAVYQSARKLIVLSTAFKELLIRDFGIQPDRIEVIPGAIDTAAFTPNSTRKQARAHFSWPQDRPIILCVRRLVHRMGLEQLLRAMVMVRDEVPEAILLVVGKGPLSTELAEQVAALGLLDHVRLLGFVPNADLPLAYRAADLSVVPSQALEGFGLITLESLAAGTPVLVTPVGGLPEAVCNLDEALVLRGTSSSHIADGLIAALTNRIRLPGAEVCHSYVKNNFDWSVIMPRVLKVYGDAMAD